jgi:hypothetical protein
MKTSKLFFAISCTCWDGDVVLTANVNGSEFNVRTSGR